MIRVEPVPENRGPTGLWRRTSETSGPVGWDPHPVRSPGDLVSSVMGEVGTFGTKTETRRTVPPSVHSFVRDEVPCLPMTSPS